MQNSSPELESSPRSSNNEKVKSKVLHNFLRTAIKQRMKSSIKEIEEKVITPIERHSSKLIEKYKQKCEEVRTADKAKKEIRDKKDKSRLSRGKSFTLGQLVPIEVS
jgi:hypothetical protein